MSCVFPTNRFPGPPLGDGRLVWLLAYSLNPTLELWSVVLIIRLETLDISGEDGFIRSRQGMVRIVLLKVLLPLAIVGGSIVTLIVLHLDGTLREFL
jgi:hypothetical protein